MGLPTLAVRKPVFVVMIFVGIFLMGIISLTRLQLELYQGTTKGIVSIIINIRGGLAPQEVEFLVTKPVEEAVGTVSHLTGLYSSTKEGESRVTMVFEPGTDMRFATLEVREKFGRVRSRLPDEIEKPVIANYNETDSAVLSYAFTSATKTPEELRQLIEEILKPELARVDGVASVEVFGGRERKILIEIDKDRLFAYNLSIDRVMDAIGAANLNILAGMVESGSSNILIRTEGFFKSLDDIRDVGISTTAQGSIITLTDIATVKDSYNEPQDYSRLNLDQNVSVSIKKASTANTIRVGKYANRMIEDFEELYDEDVNAIKISDQAATIQKAINEVRNALLIGVCLTCLVIYLFLRKIKLALIVLFSIPTSLLATFILMDFMGISINIMTLSGIALAIGSLVDTSIVILENIFKRKQQGDEHLQAVVVGSEEVWLALLSSTLTSIAVFLPIIFIDKEIQLLYQGLAFTVCATLAASLFISLMLVPMLMSFMQVDMAPKQKTYEEAAKGNRFFTGYTKALRFSFKFRYIVILVVFGLFLVAAHGIANKPVDRPRTLEENEFGVIIFPIAGAKLDANDEAAQKIEDLLNEIPEINQISALVRKDDLKIYCKLVDKSKRKRSKEEIMNYVKEKGNELVKEVHDDYSLIVDKGISGDDSAKLIVNIFGQDNAKLEQLAHQAAQGLNKVDGYTNIVMTDLRKRPEYVLVVDKGRAAYYSLSVKEIADQLHAQIRGMRPTKFHETEEGKEIEIISRLQAIYRQKIEDLERLYVVNSGGDQIRVSQIASFYPANGPQTIDRRDKYRYVFVKGDVTGRAMEEVARDIKVKMSALQYPKDYFYRFGGDYDKLIESKTQLGFAVGITIVLIYMILAILFESFLQPLIIMVSVPLAAIGVYAALEITHKPLSQNVFIGMIMLVGIVVGNAILLIDRMNMIREDVKDRYEILVRAGVDRLRPIAMTTISSLFGFMPMAIGWGQASDLWSPLAIAVIGGLLSSSILTLFIIPNICLIVEDIQIFIAKLSGSLKSALPAKQETI